jgi:hypothetical protein
MQNSRGVRAERHVVTKQRLGYFDKRRMLHETLEYLAVRKQPANVLLASPIIASAERGSGRRGGDFQGARARLRRFRRGHQIRDHDESRPIDDLLHDRG